LIRYRTFRNSDPPALAEIWRSQPPQPRLAQPMSATVWEQYVLGKTYFDPHGLIVATDGARPIGFVHAGFGPTQDLGALEYSRGVLCRLMTTSHPDRGVVASELLAAAEDYLARRGAQSVVVDHLTGLGPFYLGLYGSASLAGVVASDAALLETLGLHGYVPAEPQFIVQRNLAGFRPPMDRDQLRLRRLLEVRERHDPVATSWWEACATSHLERTLFEIAPRGGGTPQAAVLINHLPLFGQIWGVQSAGIEHVSASAEAWQNGLVTMLVADSLKALSAQGTMLVEAVVEGTLSPLAGVLRALGFSDAERGIPMYKSLGNQAPTSSG
jgi:hypothetical protein